MIEMAIVSDEAVVRLSPEIGRGLGLYLYLLILGNAKFCGLAEPVHLFQLSLLSRFH